MLIHVCWTDASATHVYWFEIQMFYSVVKLIMTLDESSDMMVNFAPIQSRVSDRMNVQGTSLLSPFCRNEQHQHFIFFRSTAKHPQGLYRRCVKLYRLTRHPNSIWASLPWATVEVQIYFIRFFCSNQPRSNCIIPYSSEMSFLPS